MGTHSWAETCPHCGYKEMLVWQDTKQYGESVLCYACGYDMHPTESIPSEKDIKLVQRTMAEMPSKEFSKLMEELTADNAILLDYLKDTAKEV